MEVIIFLIGIIFGLTLGIILSKIIFKKYSGDIIINKSDPNKDLYSIELGISLDDLDSKREVLFKVVAK